MNLRLTLLAIVFAVFTFSCKDKNKSKEITVIPIEEVQQAIDNTESLQLVDVRTLEEFRAGHLPNAKNICVTDDDFQEKVAGLDKDRPIYVYCRSGKRSAKAAKILREMGFTEIYDMDGGILNWEESDYQVQK